MKSKYLYLLIFVLIVTNILTVFNDRKKGPRKNSDFYREIKFLKKELEFTDNQIDLAKEEYKRYKNKKDSIENKFRKYDIVIMNDISVGNNNNSENMEKYYGIAKRCPYGGGSGLKIRWFFFKRGGPSGYNILT